MICMKNLTKTVQVVGVVSALAFPPSSAGHVAAQGAGAAGLRSVPCVPRVEGPIGSTTDSSPYRRVDLPANVVEQEFFVSCRVAAGEYRTLVHVRAPKDPARASGIVVVEPWHPGNLWPLYAKVSEYEARTGHTAVIVVGNPMLLADTIKQANVTRYATLSLPGTGARSVADTAAGETTEFEVLSQVGTLIKGGGLPGVRARQKRGEKDGRRIGAGLAIFCEQAAHGTSVYHGWGIPMVPGHEQCTARLTPDGVLELRIGAHSHGQGLETTLAQVANQILGVDPADVRLVHGDTALTPYSTGTWGSRCMVMSGGAVATACEEIARRAARIGAKLLQTDPDKVRVAGGKVIGPGGSVTLNEIAHVWHLKPQHLPTDVDPGGLEATAGYKPLKDTGTFSYAAHAAVVAVDTDTGRVEILKYAVVEDGGVLVNPMIVDGQVLGGAAQGIGTALYEEMPFDANGQPLASTLADYILPGATEVPDIGIDHMESPSPWTRFGQKGIGEGGAIGPPAAIANAVNDALRDLGVEVTELPMTPRRLRALIQSKHKSSRVSRLPE